ncbi:MAG: hypothetical protein ACLFVA_01455 [Dehalococcoidia bacterium]
MKKERISCHECVRRMYDRIKNDGMSNICDRYEADRVEGISDRRSLSVGAINYSKLWPEASARRIEAQLLGTSRGGRL